MKNMKSIMNIVEFRRQVKFVSDWSNTLDKFRRVALTRFTLFYFTETNCALLVAILSKVCCHLLEFQVVFFVCSHMDFDGQ